MFSGKKNKVNSTLDPPSKTMQQPPDHQQLSMVLQQVTGQLNLMLELQQQQQQETKNSFKLTDFCNANTMEEHDPYECTYRHHEHRESCHGNASQSNFCRNSTRALHQKHHQQCPVSPTLSSFFSSTHQPQHQCMSICPHDIWQQKYNPCRHHQPSYGYASFQQSQCLNSAIHRYQQPCYHYPQHHHYHHCTTVSNPHGPCSRTQPDLPTTITSPQSAIIPESVRSLNVSDPTNHTASTLNHHTSFGPAGPYKNNTPYTTCPLSVRTTTTSSTRTKFNKPYTDPPLPRFPGFGTYDTDEDAATTNEYYGNDDDGTRQRPTSPSFSNFANSTPPPPPPPPRRRMTENLPPHRHHKLSWTDIYRQDLLSRHDALISPTVSSYNNVNTVHMNKVKKTKPGRSHLRGWWMHGKYRWNQLRKKKFTKCFI